MLEAETRKASLRANEAEQEPLVAQGRDAGLALPGVRQRQLRGAGPMQ